MTLMYSEVEGDDSGHVVLESLYKRHDRAFAKKHAFELKEINSGRLATVERPVREVTLLNLPAVEVSEQEILLQEEVYQRKLTVRLPDNSPYLRLSLPIDMELQKAWVNGVLALDASRKQDGKRKSDVDFLSLVYPGSEPIEIELLTGSGQPATVSAVSWHELPGVLTAPFLGNWPDEARPFLFGPRAEKIQEFTLPGASKQSVGSVP
jgi:hypothetical protein